MCTLIAFTSDTPLLGDDHVICFREGLAVRDSLKAKGMVGLGPEDIQKEQIPDLVPGKAESLAGIQTEITEELGKAALQERPWGCWQRATPLQQG